MFIELMKGGGLQKNADIVIVEILACANDEYEDIEGRLDFYEMIRSELSSVICGAQEFMEKQKEPTTVVQPPAPDLRGQAGHAGDPGKPTPTDS